MNPYNNYSEIIRDAVQKNKNKKSGEILNLSRSSTNLNKGVLAESNANAEPNLKPLSDILKIVPSSTSKLGEHADFLHLIGTNKTEMHHITSVFIDIKSSTSLHSTYDLETIHVITNTIQKAAIHTCLVFGGHIQRLQGDGVFVYFGGKKVNKQKSLEMALNASSLFTYFVKNDLKNIFAEDGVEDIYTRIGIDFGDDDKVMWANYGLGSFSELTTLSLHTSLASKMLQFAASNGIVVGENVKNLMSLPDIYYTSPTDNKYIYKDNKNKFYYSQFQFDWFKYLKTLSFIKSQDDGTVFVHDPEKAEKERQAKLKEAADLIRSGNAYTNNSGNIVNSPSGVKNQDHRFHYEIKSRI